MFFFRPCGSTAGIPVSLRKYANMSLLRNGKI